MVVTFAIGGADPLWLSREPYLKISGNVARVALVPYTVW